MRKLSGNRIRTHSLQLCHAVLPTLGKGNTRRDSDEFPGAYSCNAAFHLSSPSAPT